MAIDSLLAIGIVVGLTTSDVLTGPQTASLPGWTQSLLLGALGPLALRSPIRTKEVRSEQAPIGITYIYDIVRLYLLFAVDERMIRLRRADVTELRNDWTSAGVTPQQVADYLSHHIHEHPQLSNSAKEEATETVRTSMTLPTEAQQMDALIKFTRLKRFSSVRDHFSSASAIAEPAGKISEQSRAG